MTTADTRRDGRRIPSLDGLRAISILLVFVGHLAGTRHFFSSAAIAHLGDLGNLGVRTFFVISGFLITGLLIGERAERGRISLKAFYMRRVLRIFPAFYAFIGVVAILTLAGFVTNDRRDFLHALTYSMNYEATSDNFSLRHLWSLSVEEQFYFMWPMTLALLGAARGSMVLAAVLAFVPMLRLGLFHLVPGYEAYVMTAFESVCDALAAGALLAIVLPKIKDRRWFRAIVASSAFPILFLVVFVANVQTEHPHLFWLVAIPVMNVSIALIVARYVECPDLPFGRALNTRALAAVGTISYSLYLWQQLFLVQWRTPGSILQEFPLNIVCVFACGIASYTLVEQPFLRLKRRFEPARMRQVVEAPRETTSLDVPTAELVPGSPTPA